MASRYVAGMLRKAGFTRAEVGVIMKPFPKWFGVLSAIMAAIPGLMAAYQTGGWTALLLAVMGLVGGGGAVLSHSLTGTGGK